jgi:hypothetical protein
MRFHELETVVLDRDQPGPGLRKGDLGTVVGLYEPDGVEVEFGTASGRTVAVLTLEDGDLRKVTDSDLMSVRPFERRSA